MWPDEGDIDMFALAECLYEAGYQYMLMPDHAPAHPDDQSPAGSSGRIRHGWAFQFGYITSIIQAIKRSRGLKWENIRTPPAVAKI